MSAFSEPLRVEYLDGRTWRLIAEFEYHGSGERIVVPAGYVTDFASIPRLLWVTLPPTGKYGKAAVIHDYLYSMGGWIDGKKRYTRAQADRIFRDAMQVLGVGWIRRNAMYLAVRAFGRGAF